MRERGRCQRRERRKAHGIPQYRTAGFLRVPSVPKKHPSSASASSAPSEDEGHQQRRIRFSHKLISMLKLQASLFSGENFYFIIKTADCNPTTA